MQYAFLIYCDEDDEPHPGRTEFDSYLEAFVDFTDEVKAKGIHLGSAELQPVGTATTVRVRNGTPLATDGPFAETKEQLGGFYLLECRDLDEALDYAARIPAARHGSIEVRPLNRRER